MKKLINTPDHLLHDALAGLAAAHGDILTVRFNPDLVVRNDAPVANKVALIAGGGAGHEPLHTGFVGRGMLDAACPGAIFTAPVPDQIFAATKSVHSGQGVLYLVKNYTGDTLNFEFAAEMAELADIEVATVLIHDDVAVQDSLYTAGRRGVGLTLLLEKIVGAAAEAGADLATCQQLAAQISAHGRSMGMALTSCTVPHHGKPTFELPADEFELGIGIHGEPGRQRAKMASAAAIAEQLALPIIADLPFQAGDEVLALVNGMGATPLIELYVMYNELRQILNGHGITITRRLVGNYITALDMAGCSFTLLKLDPQLTTLWDAPVCTPALRWGV
ncbi:MAG: dihydroxyacetone kinase subunit DhaK [Candidatus Viridilinea halotolerans]|uniref:phosphoenolpyruvate--glycerone phosphotransferase n=1 Tax=Candidatus Viridilinea halotolerans TaxID=2491704 RepID=A0A426TUQ5_9CHLR|nr:MAG: dihydroxyacetone kinase subunit DhaK [Candidatus Viridilinea halotolerans]